MPLSSGSSGSSESGYADSVSDSSEEFSPTTTESEWSDAPLLHAIIIPNYKEEIDTLRETLDILGSHIQAETSYEVSHSSMRTSRCMSQDNTLAYR